MPHLDGVQAHGLHALQAGLPVDRVYTVVMDAAGMRILCQAKDHVMTY